MILKREIGDDAAQVNVATPLAQAIDRPLNLPRTLPDSGQCVRHGEVTVVMRVDSNRNRDRPGNLRNSEGNFLGQSTAVGVAKDDPCRTSGRRRLDRPQRVFRIPLEPIEEMLGVINHVGHVRRTKGHRVADHPQVFFERYAQEHRERASPSSSPRS